MVLPARARRHAAAGGPERGVASCSASKEAPQWLGSGLYRCALMLGVTHRSIRAVKRPNRTCSVDRMRDLLLPARACVGMLSRRLEPSIASDSAIRGGKRRPLVCAVDQRRQSVDPSVLPTWPLRMCSLSARFASATAYCRGSRDQTSRLARSAAVADDV